MTNCNLKSLLHPSISHRGYLEYEGKFQSCEIFQQQHHTHKAAFYYHYDMAKVMTKNKEERKIIFE